MRHITLRYIKRIGLAEWRAREWWARQDVAIWSDEHGAYWRPNAEGYTALMREAWQVDFPTAYDYTKHCGPEKMIRFISLPGRPHISHERGSV
jgi:hypothetical protein